MVKEAYMNQDIFKERKILPKPSKGEITEHQDSSQNDKPGPEPGSSPKSRLASDPQTNRPVAQGIPSEQGQQQSSSFPSSQLSSDSSQSVPPQGVPVEQGQRQSSSESSAKSSLDSSSDSSERLTLEKLKQRIEAWNRYPE